MKNRQSVPQQLRTRHFCTDKIDRIEDLNLNTISREDLIEQYGTGVSIPHGAGRAKTYTYRSGVQTKAGDLKLSVWTAAAQYVVQRDGLEAEIEHLREFFTQFGYRVGRTQEEKVREILSSCISGLYQNPQWVGYVPYNQKYHPEVLKEAHLVCVTLECCREPCLVTEEQIAGSSDGKVACPICGCFSNFDQMK